MCVSVGGLTGIRDILSFARELCPDGVMPGERRNCTAGAPLAPGLCRLRDAVQAVRHPRGGGFSRPSPCRAEGKALSYLILACTSFYQVNDDAEAENPQRDKQTSQADGHGQAQAETGRSRTPDEWQERETKAAGPPRFARCRGPASFDEVKGGRLAHCGRSR